MSTGRFAPVAAAASLVGLAASFDTALSEALCSDPKACSEAAQATLLAAPLSAWMQGLFLGLLWVSVSLWRDREGYQGAGAALSLWGAAGVVLLGSQLSTAAEATLLQLGTGASLIVAISGFLSRKSEAPSRGTGAIAAWATAILLAGGTLAQTDALRAPWTTLDTAPELSRTDTVLQGSINAPYQIVAYADLSHRGAQREIAQLAKLSQTDFKLTIVPLATDSGADLASGLRCASESGRGGAYTVSILRAPTKSPMELAVATRLSAATFKACTEQDSVLTELKSRLSSSEKLGIEPPFGILMNAGDSWHLLSPKQPYLSQIATIAEASDGDS